VVRCSEPPRESLGSMGKQHHKMKAMKATLVPTRRMKSSIDGSSPRRRLLITKKRSSHGVIIILTFGRNLLAPKLAQATIFILIFSLPCVVKGVLSVTSGNNVSRLDLGCSNDNFRAGEVWSLNLLRSLNNVTVSNSYISMF